MMNGLIFSYVKSTSCPCCLLGSLATRSKHTTPLRASAHEIAAASEYSYPSPDAVPGLVCDKSMSRGSNACDGFRMSCVCRCNSLACDKSMSRGSTTKCETNQLAEVPPRCASTSGGCHIHLEERCCCKHTHLECVASESLALALARCTTPLLFFLHLPAS